MLKIIKTISYVFMSILVALSVASANGNTFGEKVVSGDNDIGELIKNLPDAQLSYWDIGLNPGFYDEGDIVYLDLVPKGVANNNDIRLTPFCDNPAGSKVTPMDNDIGQQLTKLNAAIGFLNLGGSSLYDLYDSVYLHQMDSLVNLNVSNPKSSYKPEKLLCSGFKDMRSYTGNACNVPKPATVIEYSDHYRVVVPDEIADPNPREAGNCDGMQVQVIQGARGYYYHIKDTTKFKCVSLNDANLLERVDQLDKSIESNTESIGKLTKAVNQISFSSQQTATNDVRLSSIGCVPAGTKVVDFDPDHNKLISYLACTPRFYDQNGNGQYDDPDDVYLDISMPGNEQFGVVVINDIRLTEQMPNVETII